MQARDAGNAAADATWNAAHNGVKEFTVSASDLTDDAKFTCILATVWTRYWRKSGRSGWEGLMSVSIQRTIRYPWQCTLLPTTTSAYRVFWIGWTRRSARRMRRRETRPWMEVSPPPSAAVKLLETSLCTQSAPPGLKGRSASVCQKPKENERAAALSQ